MESPLHVLIVEDSENDALIVLRHLKQGGLPLTHRRVDHPVAMTQALNEQRWDLILCDYAMPKFTCREALAILKASGLDIPFIMVSGAIGEDVAVDIMKAGAHDYVMKDRLARLIPAIQRELRDAEERRAHLQAEARLQYDALYDSLTRLANEALLLDRVRQSLARGKRHAPSRFAVLLIGLDRFRMIMDSLGHFTSDQLLIAIARMLELCVRPGDTVARMGGDEFAILLDDLPGLEEAHHIAELIHRQFELPFSVNGQESFISAGIGIVVNGIEYDRAEDVLRDAETAMHRAKSLGKGRMEIFESSMHTHVTSLLQLETDLRKALDRGEFLLYYQPIVSLGPRQVLGFEALLRWRHPERGLVPPDAFIKTCEETGLIVPIGEWTLHEACQTLRAWHDRFPAASPPTMSVNLSGKQFSHPNLANNIEDILKATGLNPRFLHLEITESVIMEDAALTANQLQHLKNLDIHLYIDDFGTGYSSLSYLRRFPIHTLKIDRSFISRMSDHEEDLEIVRTIMSLAHNMKLGVVAEGVETEFQRNQLVAMACEKGQGYLFSKPVDAERAAALLQSPALLLSSPNGG